MAKYVDVHLVLDTFERQFNTWRNIARLFARTEYVMMLDVDFYLCTPRFREVLRTSIGGMGGRDALKMFKKGMAAFVLPAFEYLKYAEGRDFKTFPNSKRVSRLQRSIIECSARLNNVLGPGTIGQGAQDRDVSWDMATRS